MIDFSRNHFELLGLAQQFRIDLPMLDARYRDLQARVHPDRFATAAADERRSALQASARVNEAYQALKDPVSRAHYLLMLRGIDAFSERDTALPMDFLERQLARRERIDDARNSADRGELAQLADDVRSEHAALETQLADAIDAQPDGEHARMLVRELRFISKLALDIDQSRAEFDE